MKKSFEDEENEVIDDALKVTSAEVLASLETMRNYISLQSIVPDNIFFQYWSVTQLLIVCSFKLTGTRKKSQILCNKMFYCDL